MNSVSLTGVTIGPSELREIESGWLLCFEVRVEDDRPTVPISYRLRDRDDLQELAAGTHVLIVGSLRHHSRLFVAAREIALLADG